MILKRKKKQIKMGIKELHEFENRWCLRCGSKDTNICQICFTQFMNRIPQHFEVYCACRVVRQYIEAGTGDIRCYHCARKVKDDKINHERQVAEKLQPQ